MKKISLVAVCSLLLLNGCTKDKKIYDLIAKIEERLTAIEKVIFPDMHEEKQSAAYDVPVGDSYVLGNKNAKVNIVAFSNFQCPYCARADSALRSLLDDEELGQKVNIAFKHFPFDRHQNARPASKAALAAGEQGSDKFWAMAEKIFSGQDKMSDAQFRVWAKEIGLDMAAFEASLKTNNDAYDKLINEDIKLGAEKAKLQGTPWILINGWLLEGDLSADSVKKFIADKKL